MLPTLLKTLIYPSWHIRHCQHDIIYPISFLPCHTIYVIPYYSIPSFMPYPSWHLHHYQHDIYPMPSIPFQTIYNMPYYPVPDLACHMLCLLPHDISNITNMLYISCHVSQVKSYMSCYTYYPMPYIPCQLSYDLPRGISIITNMLYILCHFSHVIQYIMACPTVPYQISHYSWYTIHLMTYPPLATCYKSHAMSPMPNQICHAILSHAISHMPSVISSPS
jgi:hypothetical protein